MGKFSAREEDRGLGRKGSRDSTPPRLWVLSAPLGRTRRPAMPSPRVTPWPGPSGCCSLPQRRHAPCICQSSTGIPAETGDFPAETSDFSAEFLRNEAPTMADRTNWQGLCPSGLTRRCRAWRCDRWRPAVGRHPFYLFLSTFMTAEGCNGPASMASLRFHTPPYPTRLRCGSRCRPACSPRALSRLSLFSGAAWRQLPALAAYPF